MQNTLADLALGKIQQYQTKTIAILSIAAAAFGAKAAGGGAHFIPAIFINRECENMIAFPLAHQQFGRKICVQMIA